MLLIVFFRLIAITSFYSLYKLANRSKGAIQIEKVSFPSSGPSFSVSLHICERESCELTYAKRGRKNERVCMIS